MMVTVEINVCCCSYASKSTINLHSVGMGGCYVFFLLPLYVISVQYKLQVHAVLCETLEGFVLRVPIILTYYLLLLFGCSTCC